MPACCKCADVKTYLSEKKFEYSEINLASFGGKNELRKYYEQIREKLKRDSGGQLILPLVLMFENGKDVPSNVAQDIKSLEDLLKNANQSAG